MEEQHEMYKQFARRLLGEINVNKDKRFNMACEVDKKTGAVVCVAKEYLKDNVHKEAIYIKDKSGVLASLGDPQLVKKMIKEFNLE